MMDRYLLRYFLAVVDQGNFSRAAIHANVSQPTLSAGIAKLERGLGVLLFHRSNQRVQLTGDGARFLPHARRIERDFTIAQQAMTGSATRPLLRLGILSSIPADPVARAIESFGEPAEIELMFGTERELVNQLGRGRIDLSLSIVGRPGSRFLEEAVVTEGYRMVMPATHPLAGRADVAAEDFADAAMIVRRHCEMLPEISRHFTGRGIRPRFALRSTNDERVLRMVGAGLGVTVMPASHVSARTAMARLRGFDAERTLGFQAGEGHAHLIAPGNPLPDALRVQLSTLAKASDSFDRPGYGP